MQKDNFFNRMTGRGELPISKMAGLHPPEDEEHEYIEDIMHKKISRELLASVLWSIIGIAFIIVYIYIHVKSKSEITIYFFITLAVFAMIVIVNTYRFAVVDKKLDKIVKERKYTIRDVKVHHVMPGYGTNFGKLTVKIQDEQENVYYQEFTLNRKMAKMYKNDTDTAFILIALDRNKNIYSLLSKKEGQKKEKSEEAAEE